MCRVMIITGLKNGKAKQAWEFVQAALLPMSENNNDDGVGYAALGKNGMFGERWVRNQDAFDYRKPFTKTDQAIIDNFKGSLIGRPKYNKFGTVDFETTTSIMFHTRLATCDVNLENTHPFVRDNTALIHNGVIGNHMQLTKITSTNDSETILNEYIQQGVLELPEAIDKVADRLNGWYAVGALTDSGGGQGILDIFRNDKTATLYACYIKQLDATVFCTRSEIIRAACKELKFTMGTILTVKPNVMMRINAATGELISNHEFTDGSVSETERYTRYARRVSILNKEPTVAEEAYEGYAGVPPDWSGDDIM